MLHSIYIYTLSYILVDLTKIKLHISLRSPQGALFENKYGNITAALFPLRTPTEE